MQDNRFLCHTQPTANEANIIVGDSYRITVLTPSLIRAEYSENGLFEDRASQSVFFRDFDKTAFSCTHENGVLTVETDAVRLLLQENVPFAADTLSVTLKQEPGTTWHYGDNIEDTKSSIRAFGWSQNTSKRLHVKF